MFKRYKKILMIQEVNHLTCYFHDGFGGFFLDITLKVGFKDHCTTLFLGKV